MKTETLGLTEKELSNLLTEGLNHDRILERLPGFEEYLARPGLGLALSEHSDEAFNHKHYKEYLWKMKDPDVTLDMSLEQIDWLSKHSKSEIALDYMSFCEREGMDYYGNAYHSFQMVNVMDTSISDAWKLVTAISDDGESWGDIERYIEESSDAAGIYREYLMFKHYDVYIPDTISELLVTEASMIREVEIELRGSRNIVKAILYYDDLEEILSLVKSSIELEEILEDIGMAIDKEIPSSFIGRYLV